MSENVKEQVINEIKAFSLFCLQVDETTDVASCAQLLFFVRYFHLDTSKNNFCFTVNWKVPQKVQIVWKKYKLFF